MGVHPSSISWLCEDETQEKCDILEIWIHCRILSQQQRLLSATLLEAIVLQPPCSVVYLRNARISMTYRKESRIVFKRADTYIF
jgi:hypothetical protein